MDNNEEVKNKVQDVEEKIQEEVVEQVENTQEVEEKVSEEVMGKAENVQEVVEGEVSEEKPDQIDENEEKDNKLFKMIGIAVVTLLLVLVVIIAIAMGRESKSEKFVKLLIEEQKVYELFEENQKYCNSKFTTNIDNIAEDLNLRVPGFGRITFETKVVRKGDNATSITALSSNKVKSNVEMQVVRNSNMIGLNIPGITENFVAMDFSDVEGLMSNLQELGIINQYESDEKVSNKQSKEMKEMLEKYLKLLAKNVNPYIKENGNVEFSIDGNTDSGKEYVLGLKLKDIMQIAINMAETLEKNKKDLSKLESWGFIEDAEDFEDELKDFIDDTKDEMEDIDDEGVFYVKLYEKDGKNVATIFEFDSEYDSEDFSCGMYYFDISKKEQKIIVAYNNELTNVIIICLIETEKDVKSGSVRFESESYGRKSKTTLLRFEIDNSPKEKADIIKLDKEDVLLLNTASEDDLEYFIDDLQDNFEEFMDNLLK